MLTHKKEQNTEIKEIEKKSMKTREKTLTEEASVFFLWNKIGIIRKKKKRTKNKHE